jgi:23S rRNA (adenine2503-C2)-methyltransferase
MEKSNIIGLLPNDLLTFLEMMSEPSYRSKQITHWLYQQKATTWDEMKNLPLGFRQVLSQRFDIGQIKIETKMVSSDQSMKYLLRLADGNGIEIVVIPHRKRITICLSTQVGCPVGCSFCATGQSGFSRNLTYQEIVESAWKTQIESNSVIKNIVFMGMGEPLLNYEQLSKAIQVFNHSDGFNIGSRNMTVSTIGIPDKIIKLAQEWPQVNLAVSLHAPKNELRKQLIPINDVYPISQLMKTIEQYIALTHRRVTIEYSLWTDINDQREYAFQLASLLRGLLVHVNLIPGNPIAECHFVPSSPARVMTFARILEDNKINVTIREPRGQDIGAACGELYGLHHKRGVVE